MKGEYPTIKVMPCEHEECLGTDTTPCTLTMYRGNLPAIWYIRTYGLLQGLWMLWHLWREGWVELPPHYYCAEHAKEEGFCWGCGQFWAFWAGADVGFDFLGEWLCPKCREFDYEDEDNDCRWDDDYWWEEDWYD